jgi:hypothetical protein
MSTVCHQNRADHGRDGETERMVRLGLRHLVISCALTTLNIECHFAPKRILRNISNVSAGLKDYIHDRAELLHEKIIVIYLSKYHLR